MLIRRRIDGFGKEVFRAKACQAQVNPSLSQLAFVTQLAWAAALLKLKSRTSQLEVLRECIFTGCLIVSIGRSSL